MRRLLGLALLLMSVGVSGCASYRASAPEGFAPYRERHPYRAVSPDGVMYQVRQVRHKPKAELEFWQEALKKRMVDAGYRFMRESAVKAGKHNGWLLELSAPMGEQDYTYLVGLFVVGRHLVLVEAAGEVTLLEARREALLTAVTKLELK